MKFKLEVDIVNYQANHKEKTTDTFCKTVTLPCNIQKVLQKLHVQKGNTPSALEVNVTDNFDCSELQAYIENLQAQRSLSIDDLIKINYAAEKVISMDEKKWQAFSSYIKKAQANTKSSYFENALKMF